MLSTSTIQFLNINSGAIQTISTVVLVIITIFYAWQTKLMVKEAESSRKDSRLPILKIEMRGPITHRSDKYISLTIENIGYGLARNVQIIFPNKEPLGIENLNIGEITHSQINLIPREEEIINDLPENKKVITVRYDDIFGRKVKTEAQFAHNHRGSWVEFSVIDCQPILPK